MAVLPEIVVPETNAVVAPLAFAFLRADVDLDSRRQRPPTGVYLAEVDAASRTLTEPKRVVGLRGGTTIAAGDINGDGVDDFVIGTNAV